MRRIVARLFSVRTVVEIHGRLGQSEIPVVKIKARLAPVLFIRDVPFRLSHLVIRIIVVYSPAGLGYEYPFTRNE